MPTIVQKNFVCGGSHESALDQSIFSFFLFVALKKYTYIMPICTSCACQNCIRILPFTEQMVKIVYYIRCCLKTKLQMITIVF